MISPLSFASAFAANSANSAITVVSAAVETVYDAIAQLLAFLGLSSTPTAASEPIEEEIICSNEPTAASEPIEEEIICSSEPTAASEPIEEEIISSNEPTAASEPIEEEIICSSEPAAAAAAEPVKEEKTLTREERNALAPKSLILVKPAMSGHMDQRFEIDKVEWLLNDMGVIYKTEEVETVAEYADVAAAYEASTTYQALKKAAEEAGTTARTRGMFPYVCLKTKATDELEYISHDTLKAMLYLQLMPVERQQQLAKSFVNVFATAVPLQVTPAYMNEEEWVECLLKNLDEFADCYVQLE